MRRVALLSALMASAFAQQPDVPYLQFYGPTFSNEQVGLSFKGSYSTIRKVDFQNLSPLRKGHYQRSEPYDHFSTDLDKIYYLRRSASSAEDAAINLYFWFDVGVSSSQGENATVFTVERGACERYNT